MPKVGLPPVVPLTAHEIVPLTPLSLAVNCLLAPARTDVLLGETVTGAAEAAADSTRAAEM